jgi:RNA polymerase sigma-70 factor (ECF subfamily)
VGHGSHPNRAAAEDLVQAVAMKTLVASESFIPGTNFSAWVHRIMVNHFKGAATSGFARC